MRIRPAAQTSTALTRALTGVLIVAAFVSTGCVHSQRRGALLGAVIGAGVGLLIASDTHRHRSGYSQSRPAYDHDTHHRRAHASPPPVRRKRGCN